MGKLLNPFLGPILVLALAFLLYQPGASSVEASSGDDPYWPTEGGNSQHTWVTNRTVRSLEGSLVWHTTIDNGVYGIPAIGADGTIYLATHDSKLYAIDQDGKIKWTKTVQKYNSHTVTIGPDGTLYLASDGTQHNVTVLYAIAPDGTTLWQHDLTENVSSMGVDFGSPAIIGEDGSIYITAGGSDVNGTITSFICSFASDGRYRWAANVTGFLYTPAVGHEGHIYVGSDLGVLYAFDPNGSLLWSTDLGHGKDHAGNYPAVGPDGTVYLVLGALDVYSNHTLYAIMPNGTLSWTYDIVEVERKNLWLPVSRPAIGRDGTIYLNIGIPSSGYTSTDHPAVLSINPNGTLNWRCETLLSSTGGISDLHSGLSPLLIDGQDRILGVAGNNVFIITRDGGEIAHYFADNVYTGLAIGPEGMVLAVNAHVDIWAFDGFPTAQESNGWSIDPNVVIAIIVIAPIVVVMAIVVVLLRRP